MKIAEIKYSSGPDLRQIIDLEHYNCTMAELGVLKFRPYNDFEKAFREDLKILVKDFYVSIIFTNGTKATMHFKTGFCFDGASIPQIFRSLLKANGRKMIIAAMVHDGLWGSPGDPFGFETSNDIFEQLLKMYDVWGVWWIMRGVNTGIARRRYDMLEGEYDHTESKCVTTWGDKVLYLDKLQFCRKGQE